ncbi:hypothetical protein H4S08_003018 [Coemansia sp. RSA 1365]|nr:hypothetical protein H4S08_003018 [Coemansia sp. RSA 1365]
MDNRYHGSVQSPSNGVVNTPLGSVTVTLECLNENGNSIELKDADAQGLVVYMGLASEDGTIDVDSTPKKESILIGNSVALSLGPGLLNAYGVFEEEYDRLYDSKDDKHKTSGSLDSPVIFIGVIQIFVANGMGFIGGQCAQRFGPGPSVFAGGLLMAIGLFVASYSHKIWQLCLTQGLIFGIGVCLTWIPAASAPSSWFEKNRGLATGITHMGLGIGGLIFSPLTRFLLEKFGTAGALHWLALIILIGVTIASIGVHSKHHDLPVNDIVIGSVRWSRCLVDKAIDFENGYNSDSMSYEEYRRASSISRARASSLISTASEKHLSVSMDDGNQIEPCNLDNISNQDWHDGSKEIGIESLDEDISPTVPKHVRFVSEFARRITLRKLEAMGTPAAPAAATSSKEDKDNKETSTTNSNGKTSKPSSGNKPEGKVTKKMLKEAEQELYQLLLKKKQSDRNLIDAETAIYDFETSYFENSGQEGNVVFGFEGYLNTGRHERRQMHFTESDRIFSQSSATFKKAQEAKIAAMLDSDSDESETGGRIKGRKGVGGSTIKHNRQGTPTPAPRSTKKIRLSMDRG